MSKRAARWFGATLIAVGACALAFYGNAGWWSLAESKRLGLSGARNSIQHAYAAAQAYGWLRTVGLSRDNATDAVIQLGYLNEWFENDVQSRDDSTAEIYKDLNNNMSGIVAAQWLENCETRQSGGELQVTGALAQAKSLFYKPTDTRIPKLPDEPDVSVAIAQFKLDRATIEARVKADLDTIEPACALTRN
jgi:hypothetical protein